MTLDVGYTGGLIWSRGRVLLLHGILGAILLLNGVLGGPAQADTQGNGPPDEGYVADSSAHSYCFGPNFNSGLHAAADHAMQNSLDRDTIMTDLFTSCDQFTDVTWRDANLSGSTRGAYDCIDLSPSGTICFASNVTLDPDQINIGSNDEEDKKKTACHEAGHSVALQHGDSKTDCMVNGEIPDTGTQWRTYNMHHIDEGHINDTY